MRPDSRELLGVDPGEFLEQPPGALGFGTAETSLRPASQRLPGSAQILRLLFEEALVDPPGEAETLLGATVEAQNPGADQLGESLDAVLGIVAVASQCRFQALDGEWVVASPEGEAGFVADAVDTLAR